MPLSQGPVIRRLTHLGAVGLADPVDFALWQRYASQPSLSSGGDAEWGRPERLLPGHQISFS